MEHENKNVFRYVEQLLKGHLCNNYNIGIFASKHNDIESKTKRFEGHYHSLLSSKGQWIA